MKRVIRIIMVAVLCVLCVGVLKSWADNKKDIVVEIDYGSLRPARMVEVPLEKGRTALEVLQTVAMVETHPVGKYVMVTSIDDVRGERGKMAWYYTVDGESADKIAYSNVVKRDTKHIKWSYKKDVCSGKVDGEI